MLFAIVCVDKTDGTALRQATRARHLAYLQSHLGALREAGPLLSPEGQAIGSLLVVDFPDRQAAEAFAAADPYARAGLFDRSYVHAYRSVFYNGKQVG